MTSFDHIIYNLNILKYSKTVHLTITGISILHIHVYIHVHVTSTQIYIFKTIAHIVNDNEVFNVDCLLHVHVHVLLHVLTCISGLGL